MSQVPTISPYDREQIRPAESYQQGGPVWVWVWSEQGWRPGLVRGVGSGAVLVDYWGTGRPGTLTDSFTDVKVMPRDEPDGATL